MKLLHEKSQCCAAKIIRFGGKRRQCVVCKKTWRVHPAKPGRKALWKQRGYLPKVFCRGFSVKQVAARSGLATDVVYKRFSRHLLDLTKRQRTVRYRGQKLILVIDALWQYFKGELWTLYCLGIRATTAQTITLIDPVLRPGRENAATWNEIINDLAPTAKKRVIALVSDGIRGMEAIAENNDWIIQRCHFHLLSKLQKMRGKRASTVGRLVREEIYCAVKLALSETSVRRLNSLGRRLAGLAQAEGCPKKMRMADEVSSRQAARYHRSLDAWLLKQD